MKASAWKFSQKLFGEGGLRLLSTLFILLLARHLGAEEFGRYSSALAFAALCIVFVDLGTNAILIREIARHPDLRLQMAQTSHLLKVMAAVLSWSLLLVMTYVLSFSADQRALTMCLGIVVIGQTLMEYFSALLTAIEEMGWEALLKIVSRALALGFAIWAILAGKPLNFIVLAMVGGTVLSYAASVTIVRSRYGAFGFSCDTQFLKTLYRSCLPLIGCIMFWILYDVQDILLLNYFHFPQRDIGWFSAAMKVIDVLRVYPVLLMGVFFPVLSRLHESDRAAFRVKQRRLFIVMSWSLCLLSGAVYFAAPTMIALLYKGDFSPAANYLQLLLPALFGMGLTHIQMQLLIALNQERKLFAGAILACGSNLFLAWVFLPRWGIPGVCYALWGSEFIYFVFLRFAAITL